MKITSHNETSCIKLPPLGKDMPGDMRDAKKFRVYLCFRTWRMLLRFAGDSMERVYPLVHGTDRWSMSIILIPTGHTPASFFAFAMPERDNNHYRGRIYGRLYRKPVVAYECMGLFRYAL